MSDAGSSSEIGKNRPKMSAAAAGPYQQGMQAFVAGDLQNAKKFFQAAIAADDKAYQAHYSLGVVQERLREEAALASYKSAFTIIPDYEPAIVSYALFNARKGRTSEADTFLTQKRNQLPKSAALLSAHAEVKSLMKDTANAQKFASEALKINPDYKPAMVVIARDHYRGRRIDLALYALQAILDGFEPVNENPPRDKENAEALLIRALIYREQGNRAGAMDQFQKAVARRPDLVEARVQLATMLLEAGSPEQALPLAEGALRFDSTHLPAHLVLGDVYRLQSKYAEAKQRFDYVVSKDASLPQVHYNLGLLYLFAPSIQGMTPMQQVDAATASLKKYQELRPKGESDDSDELLNRAKLKRGELEAAKAAAAPVPATPPPPAPAPGKPGQPAPAGQPPAGAQPPAGGAPAPAGQPPAAQPPAGGATPPKK
ncbi:MAG: tetratricopeptide repeat protein [Polyangiaceae bacterium]|nr:tetratricopeptide repeat protein [Polyangiaceae bacterium]